MNCNYYFKKDSAINIQTLDLDHSVLSVTNDEMISFFFLLNLVFT